MDWLRKLSLRDKIVYALFGILVVVGVFGLFMPGEDKPKPIAEESADAPSKSEAWTMAKEFVEDRLKSPASADYGGQVSSETVTQTGENTFSVSAWVDSENAFGATIRTRFDCKLRYRGDGNWRCEELAIHD